MTWKTAAEWAAEKLDGVPTTRQGILKVEKVQGWRDRGPSMARKRHASGGGWEYHVSCLPDAAQADWQRRQRAAEAKVEAERSTGAVQKAVATTLEGVTARRRQIMESRAVVMVDIQRREFVEGSASKAIASLLDEARQGLLEPVLMQHLQVAADKKRSAIPSRSRLFAWRQAYRDGGPRALLPEVRPQEAKQDHPEWLSAFLRFYCKGSKVTLHWALEKFSESLADPRLAPSYDQVRRAMKGLQGTARALDAFKGREGPLALKARMAFVRRSTDGIEPTEIYTSDGKTFDAYVAHPIHGRPFRPEITPVIDVATRKLVGWSVDLAENSRGVADAVRVACENHGIPAIFYTDRGPGFKNDLLEHEVTGICARLGITTTHSLPYVSQSRGIIERSHRTIWTPLAKAFPTYCGDDMDRETFQRQHKAIGRDIKTFGSSNALPSWEYFMEQVRQAVDAYNNRPHSSLRIRDAETGRMRKASPNEMWANFVAKGFEPISLDAGEADDLFRPYFRRKVARCEINWNTNQYFSQALGPWDDQFVLIGVDIHDASRIWVRRLEDVDGKDVPGALICVAEFAGNSKAYFPKTMLDSAKEGRTKGRLRRVDAKQTEIMDESRGVYFLEDRAGMPAPVIDLSPVPVPEPVALAAADPAPAPAPAPITREAPLHDDPEVDIALRVMADPSLITPGWRRLIEEKLGRPAGRRIMEHAGIDVWALRDLIASIPAADNNSRNIA